MKSEIRKPKSETAAVGAPGSSWVGIVLLLGLLLVLAVRLTMTESLSQSMSQVAAGLATRADPQAVQLPEVGPGVTVGLACAAFFLAGLAGVWGGKKKLGGAALGKLALIFVVLGLGMISVWGAENRFTAVVGLLDLGGALAAGWAVSVLCRREILGDAGRRLVAAVLVGVLTVWIARGFYQRLVEFPDTLAFFEANQEKALSAQGLHADDPAAKLYESRMKSNEVAGYLSLSNVMATGMVGLIAVLCGAIGAAWVWGRRAEEAPKKKSGVEGPREISTAAVFLICAGIVLLGGLGVTFLTASRGGSAMAVAAVVALSAGFWKREWVAARRKQIVIGAGVLFVMGMAAMIGYGLVRDTLPGKSMMFRWHYWTGGAGLIRDHPLIGVGLNNFGDYYPAYKRASSPEEVKDPHSFFVRIAAEMGVPAALAVGVLLVWMLAGAARRTRTAEEQVERPPWGTALGLAVGAIFCLLWWTAHQLIAEPWDFSTVYFTGIAAVLSWVGFGLGWMLTARLTAAGFRAIAAAAAVGAIGMFCYDQVNMALVTGPVAMLFWMLAGLADSYAERRAGIVGWPSIFGGILCAGALAAGMLAWIPILQEKMLWDPYPYEVQAARAINSGNLRQAEAALDAALVRWPLSVDLQLQRMYTRRQLHEPTAADIQRMLTLTRNARFYLRMGTEDSDLPAGERVRILEEAQALNDALPQDEIMHFTPEEERQLQEALARLKQ